MIRHCEKRPRFKLLDVGGHHRKRFARPRAPSKAGWGGGRIPSLQQLPAFERPVPHGLTPAEASSRKPGKIPHVSAQDHRQAGSERPASSSKSRKRNTVKSSAESYEI